jgi:hypothetical protein
MVPVVVVGAEIDRALAGRRRVPVQGPRDQRRSFRVERAANLFGRGRVGRGSSQGQREIHFGDQPIPEIPQTLGGPGAQCLVDEVHGFRVAAGVAGGLHDTFEEQMRPDLVVAFDPVPEQVEHLLPAASRSKQRGDGGRCDLRDLLECAPAMESRLGSLQVEAETVHHQLSDTQPRIGGVGPCQLAVRDQLGRSGPVLLGHDRVDCCDQQVGVVRAGTAGDRQQPVDAAEIAVFGQ